MRLLLFALCFSFSFQGIAAQSDNRNVLPFHVDGLGAASVIRQIANKTGINIGLEADVILGKEPAINRDFPGGSLEDVARLCASLINGGSWIITPKRGIIIRSPGKAVSLGEVSFDYSEQTQANRKLVWNSLEAIPAIRQWLELKGCKRSELFRGHEWEADDATIHIPHRNSSLEAFLDIATEESNTRFWSILANSRDGRCEIYISLW